MKVYKIGNAKNKIEDFYATFEDMVEFLKTKDHDALNYSLANLKEMPAGAIELVGNVRVTRRS